MLKIKVFTFNPVQENTYVIYNEQKECLIIDPGCYFKEEQEELVDFVESNELKPVLLVNTHCHLDHVFGLKFISEKYGLTPHIHEKERKVLEYAPTSAKMWNISIDNYEGELNFIDEEDEIVLGDEKLKIFLTPGHSPGSLCFYHEAQKFVIGGDVLFQMSIGRTDLPGGDYDTLINSIQSKLFVLPDEVIVYPGHGPKTTIGFEKMNNPFLSDR